MPTRHESHFEKIIVWYVLVCLQALLSCRVNESGVPGTIPQEPISSTLWWPAHTCKFDQPSNSPLVTSRRNSWLITKSLSVSGKNVNTKIKYASGNDNGSRVSSSFWISSRFINTLQNMSFIVIRGIIISSVVRQLQWIMTKMFP